MTAFVTAGAGFLLAVLWFDLMFDVQVVRHRGPVDLPGEVLSSISGYYGRVTTGARPMNRLIAMVMAGTLIAIVLQIVQGDAPAAAAWASLVLTAGAVALAAVHTVPNAVRLGARTDTEERQSHLARAIFRDHVLCLIAIAALFAVQSAFAR